MTDPELSAIKLRKAYDQLMSHPVVKTYAWEISPLDGEEFDVGLRHSVRREEVYLVRIRCDGFPQPPSYVFVDPHSKQVVHPQVRGYQRGWPGLCINGTREFYEKGHPERRNRWTYARYPFARVLGEIQFLIGER